MSDPFTWVFTEINGEAKEIAGDPVHRSPQDLRVYTPLYKHPASADEQLIKRKQAEAVENAFMDLATSIRKERLHGISVKGLIHAAEEYATTALNTGGKSNE